jgi:hypothetical protein
LLPALTELAFCVLIPFPIACPFERSSLRCMSLSPFALQFQLHNYPLHLASSFYTQSHLSLPSCFQSSFHCSSFWSQFHCYYRQFISLHSFLMAKKLKSV